MMKKMIAILLMACMLLSATGCSVLQEASLLAEPKETVFTIENYNLQITANSTFKDKTGGSFDLQIANDHAYISIMAYKYMDLPEDITPLDVYEIQNEDIFSKRTAVTVIEEATTISLESGTMITQALYSAEKDGAKNNYASYLIDLPHVQTLAWVMVTATPSYFDNNREYLRDIVYSMTTAQ